MDVSLFEYRLPKELIAQYPERSRDKSRLLILNRATGDIRHDGFKSILEYINPGDALVVNNTRVFKARLWGNRESGARVEIFLVRRESDTDECWHALVSPSRRVREGERIYFERAYVTLERYKGSGGWDIRFPSKTARESIIARYGHVPLPHYINRDDQPSDIRRYQTIFADKGKTGAVAAPTAGFHFTRPILKELEKKGVTLVELTLHVGPGTFKPIKTGDIDEHVVDPEYAELTTEAAEKINKMKSRGGRIIAVGTTSVRTLESAPMKAGAVLPFSGMVDLYIRPGYKFKLVERLVTNFHLPQSSLLVLVSAFAGREKILRAYTEAVRERYRFYSYGDAMLIL
ncbi:MAG: tRNA preQ1(34) S-adenosylmethionine ribosyltransferase-isomerase QueA [Candidatus Zixiibacteriota bacterium]